MEHPAVAPEPDDPADLRVGDESTATAVGLVVTLVVRMFEV